MNRFASMNADIRRRTFLGRGAAGLGLAALNSLLAATGADNAGAAW